jgi:hypothetical protein
MYVICAAVLAAATAPATYLAIAAVPIAPVACRGQYKGQGAPNYFSS